MKKNVIFRVAAIVVMCALVTACFASSTFARYTSEASGGTSVTVAKWNFDANEADISESETFNIATTIEGHNASDVQTKIAPGTNGSFDIELKNTSEVAANYQVAITTPSDFPSVITVSTPANATGTLAPNATATVTVTWDWPYGADVEDSDYNGASFDITATLTATQAE